MCSCVFVRDVRCVVIWFVCFVLRCDCVGLGFKVFVCVGCALLCDAAWYVFVCVVCLCVLRFRVRRVRYGAMVYGLSFVVVCHVCAAVNMFV